MPLSLTSLQSAFTALDTMPSASNYSGSLIYLLKRSRGIIIYQIWPELMFFTGVAVMVYTVSELTTVTLAFNNALLTVLGTVLGLVISFRTTSAYDRYWEGRKLWSTISLASRNLATLIWIHVPTDRSAKSNTPLPKDAQLKAIVEKRSMINLVQAFSASVKHYLRGETGVYYEDVYPLIAFLPKYANNEHLPLWSDDTNSHGHHTTRKTEADPEIGNGTANMKSSYKKKKRTDGFNPEGALPSITPDNIQLAPARLAPKLGFFDYVPILLPLKAIYKLFKHMASKFDDDEDASRSSWTGRKTGRPVVESVVPLEITLYLSSYFNFLLTQGLLQSAAGTSFNNNLHFLQDAAVQLRRVATTPIPFAYQAHLRMAIWLYLFFLPFQVYPQLRWIVIPATTFAAFLYLGFLEIGAEM
ncbi:unnamed protein product [Rhizoctonia solani]|uniref:Uncharacterized protein n=1 Tax=Rhizoctonia solani TaxID=456999 RepID=A0A8H3D9G8_9AGAM|nr:unnamed protein product [Rhizoctonia solani]